MSAKVSKTDEGTMHEKQDKIVAKYSHHSVFHDKEKAEPVKVYLRIRPEQISRNVAANDVPETASNGSTGKSKVLIALDDKTVRLTPPDGFNANKRKPVEAIDDRIFSFDKVYHQDVSQEDVYKDISSHVNATVRGYNTTVFAYGSTGSGKTYTMTGNSQAPGIIPRAISEIFSIIEATAAKEKDVFFYVRLSYVELYNNTFRNLLEQASKELAEKELEHPLDNGSSEDASASLHSENNNNHASSMSNMLSYADKRGANTLSPSLMHPALQKSTKIEVRESQSAGVFLAGAHLRIPVITAQEAFQLINKGNKNRATGSTQCNDYSSRSHAILTLHVESRVAPGTQLRDVLDSISMSTSSSPEPIVFDKPELRLGKMHLVDLAGSERLTMSGAEGDTLLETQSINLSLTAIGDVLAALSRNASILSKSKPLSAAATQAPTLVPVPYRNSKLTHLLKDSLGGNSKTIMIATVRTHADYYQQTVVSLMYASRAKKVRNRSLVNRDVIGDTGIHAVSTEIERLKSRLDARTHEFEQLQLAQMKESKENSLLKAKLQSLNAMNEAEKGQLEKQMATIITSQAGQLANQREKISLLQGALQKELAISQSRIKEQEKEINWLKGALDESAQAIKTSIPAEQLQRMQKIVDAWQGQAENTQRELVSAHSQIDSLRQSNTTFGAEISALQASKQELVDQVVEQRNSLERLAALEQQAKSEYKAKESAVFAMVSEVEQSRSKVAEALAMAENSNLLANKQRTRNEELMAQLTAQQQEVMWHQEMAAEFAKKTNEKIKALEIRCTELDTEKTEARRSFSQTLAMLEGKTSSTIENAVRKVQEVQAQVELECRRADKAETELANLREHLSQTSAGMHSDLQVRDQTVMSLSEQLRLAHTQSNELAAQISEAHAITKQKEEALMQISAVVTRLEAELVGMADEHRTLYTQNHDLHAEMARLNQVHAAAITALKQEHSAAVTALKQEHVGNEVEIRNHLQQTEASIRAEVTAEMQRHTDEMVMLVETHRDAFTKLQAEANDARLDHERSQQHLRKSHKEQIKHMEEIMIKYKAAVVDAENARDVAIAEKRSIEDRLARTTEELGKVNENLSKVQASQHENQMQLTAEMDSRIQILQEKVLSYQQEVEQARVALENVQAIHAEHMSQERLHAAQLAQSLEIAQESHAERLAALERELRVAQGTMQIMADSHAQELLQQKSRAEQEVQAARLAHLALAKEQISAEQAATSALDALDAAKSQHAQDVAKYSAQLDQAQQAAHDVQKAHAECIAAMERDREAAMQAERSAQEALIATRSAHEKELQERMLVVQNVEAASKSYVEQLALLKAGKNDTEQSLLAAQKALELVKEAHAKDVAKYSAQLDQAQQAAHDVQKAHAECIAAMERDREAAMQAERSAQEALIAERSAHEKESHELEARIEQRMLSAVLAREHSLQHELSSLSSQLHETARREVNLIAAVEAGEKAIQNADTVHRNRQSELQALCATKDAELYAKAKELTMMQTRLLGSAAVVEELELQLNTMRDEIKAMDQRAAAQINTISHENELSQRQIQEQHFQAIRQLESEFQEKASVAIVESEQKVFAARKQLSEAQNCIHTLEQERTTLQGELTAARLAIEAETARHVAAVHAADESRKAMEALQLNWENEQRKAQATQENSSHAMQAAIRAANAQAQELYKKQLVELEQKAAAHLVSALDTQKTSLLDEHRTVLATLERRQVAAEKAATEAREVADALRISHEVELKDLGMDVDAMRRKYMDKLQEERALAQQQLTEALNTQKEELQNEHQKQISSLEDLYAEARTQADARANASNTAVDAAAAQIRQLQERIRDMGTSHAASLASARAATDTQLQKQLASQRTASQAMERAHDERCAALQARLSDALARSASLESLVTELQQRVDEEERSMASMQSKELEHIAERESEQASQVLQLNEQLACVQSQCTQLQMQVTSMQAERDLQTSQIERTQAALAEQRLLRQQLEVQLTTSAASAKDERVKEMQRERAEHAKELSLVKSDRDAAIAEVNLLRTSSEQRQKDQEVVCAEMLETIASLRSKEESLIRRSELDLQSLRDMNTQNIQELRESFRKQQDLLEKQHAGDMESLKSAHSETLTKLEGAAETRVSTNAAMTAKLVKALEDETKKLHDKLVDKDERLAESERQNRVVVEQLSAMENAHSKRIANLLQEHTTALSHAEADVQRLEERLKSIEKSKVSELESLRADYAAAISDLRDTFRLQRQTLEEQNMVRVTAAEERLKEEVVRHQRDVQRMQAAADDEKSRLSMSLQVADARVVDARKAADAMKEEMSAAINTLRSEKDAAVSQMPKLQAELRALRADNEELQSQVEIYKKQSAEAEHAHHDTLAVYRENLRVSKAETLTESKQTEILRKTLEAERVSHEIIVKECNDRLHLQYNAFEDTRNKMTSEHASQIAELTRVHAEEVRMHQETVLLLQERMKESERAAEVAKETALQEQEHMLRKHLDKESEHIVDTHLSEIDSLKAVHSRELSSTQEALRKAEWQVAVTMKCLTDMTDRRRLLQDHYSLDDMKQAIISREAEAVRRAAEIAAGRTPHSEPRAKPMQTNEHTKDENAKVLFANMSPQPMQYVPVENTAATPVVRRRLPLEPSVTGYSPEILNDVQEEDVEKLNNTARATVTGIAASSTTLEIVQKSSEATSGQASDELVAAILDGDVQGLRTIVRSHGGDLKTGFWKDVTPAVLPLHRAIAGLHFHGSESLLVNMLDALCSLGADVNAVDSTGNSCLHKAIQVCTSKSIVAVVSALLIRGTDVHIRNAESYTALHAECSRVRTASVYVITSLLEAGANPMLTAAAGMTPLTMILQRGAAAAAVETGSASLAQTGLDNGTYESFTDGEPRHSGSRRVWVRAAQALVVAAGGRAGWSTTWHSNQGESQLHILCAAFPPALEDAQAYEYLLSAALDSGINPGAKDINGKTAVFVLCERFALTPAHRCPGASSLLALILRHCGNNASTVVAETTRLGQHVLDLDTQAFSTSRSAGSTSAYSSHLNQETCLTAAKRLLVEATLNRKGHVSAAAVSATTVQASTTQGLGTRPRVRDPTTVAATFMSRNNTVVPTAKAADNGSEIDSENQINGNRSQRTFGTSMRNGVASKVVTGGGSITTTDRRRPNEIVLGQYW